MSQTLFAGQHMIISGGVGDIGRAIVEAFLAEGSRVSIGDRVSVEEARERCPWLDREDVHLTTVDIADSAAVHRWVSERVAAWGAPDVVIPNAAIFQAKPVLEFEPEDWKVQMDINLFGAIHLATAGVRAMVAAGKPGNVVVTGSWAAHRPHPKLAPYCVSKAGLRMFVMNFAREVAEYGIRVNEVAPGWVDGGLSGKGMKANPERRQEMTDKVPLHRLIDPKEVAWQVVQICHPKNRHSTGATFLMDGGLSLLY